MIFGGRHLDDEHLFGCYLGPEGGKNAAASADHLAACPRCSARYEELVRFMSDLRSEADVETDELFTSDRLHAQQQLIMRRIEQFGSARIISFPGHRTSRHEPGSAGRLGSRWIAGAAAAGLLVGAAVGIYYEGSWRIVPQSGSSRLARAPVSAPVNEQSGMRFEPARSSSVDDAVLLSNLEQALGGPRTKELLPFEAMTPRATDVSVRLR